LYCSKISQIEWSGVLFYKINKGSASDLSKPFEIELVDIYLMDIGTSGYTEYEADENVVLYMMDKGYEFGEVFIGHIHSHHNMKTYFSGTDMSELRTNCGNHNLYLSVIVNNFYNICAKMARLVKLTNVVASTKNEDGDDVILKDYYKNLQEFNIMEILDFNVDNVIEDEEALARYNTLNLEKTKQSKFSGNYQFNTESSKQLSLGKGFFSENEESSIDDGGYTLTENLNFFKRLIVTTFNDTIDSLSLSLKMQLPLKGTAYQSLSILKVIKHIEKHALSNTSEEEIDNILSEFSVILYSNFETEYAEYFGDFDDLDLIVNTLEQIFKHINKVESYWTQLIDNEKGEPSYIATLIYTCLKDMLNSYKADDDSTDHTIFDW